MNSEGVSDNTSVFNLFPINEKGKQEKEAKYIDSDVNSSTESMKIAIKKPGLYITHKKKKTKKIDTVLSKVKKDSMGHKR